MRKLKRPIMLLAILTLIVRSTPSWPADANLLPVKHPDRSWDEQFVNCFEERLNCYAKLKQVVQPPHADWEVVALSIAGGILGGMFLDHNLNH